MMAWGLFTIGAALAKNYTTMLVLRVFTGLTEAFIQGAVFYLSFWYKYYELATRGSFLFSTVALAGATNGLLAYAIQSNLDGHNGWKAWRWIFLIEGVIPVGWSFIVAAFLPNTPESIRWGFSSAEKSALVKRAVEAHNTGDNHVDMKLIPRLLIDPQFWLLAFIHAGVSLCTSSTSNFLPSIMEGLGYEGQRAQLMTVIVYAVSFVSILVVARISDAAKNRGFVILACCLVVAVGYILLLTISNLKGRLVATCLVAAGANSPVVIVLSWAASSNVGYPYRGSAVAIMNIVGALASIGGNQAFKDPPLYHKGLTITLVVILVTALLVAMLLLYFRYMNKKKAQEQNSEAAEELRAHTVDEIGNRHPDFFFSF